VEDKTLPFATRNSIALGVLLVLILVGGGYWTSLRQPEKLHNIEEQIKKVDFELLNTPDLLSMYNSVQSELTEWEERWGRRTKDIPTQDVTTETNAYLNSVILSSGRVKVDVQYMGPKQEGKYGYNVYSLRGEGPFYSLFRFIWYLENGRRLFKFPKMVLKEIIAQDSPGEEKSPVVQFQAEMRAYYSSIVDLSGNVAWRDTAAAFIDTNPFWPLVRPDLPKNTEGLLELARAELKAVIPGKAFISDSKGKLWTLGVGDNVYLGYVSKISPEDGAVEFVLNKAGISEIVVLKVRFRSPESEVKR
jgi:hypothetical protein